MGTHTPELRFPIKGTAPRVGHLSRGCSHAGPHRPQRPHPGLPQVPRGWTACRARVDPDSAQSRTRCPAAAHSADRPGPRLYTPRCTTAPSLVPRARTARLVGEGGRSARTFIARSTSPPSPAATPAGCQAPKATGPFSPGTSPLPTLARRADQSARAPGRSPRRSAGNPHIPGTRCIANRCRGNVHAARWRVLHSLASPFRSQPLAQ